jgi:hypothetical protein
MQIRVKLPVNINAADMMNYVRSMLQTSEPPKDQAPVDHKKIADAIASEDTKVSLVQKLTEYK